MLEEAPEAPPVGPAPPGGHAPPSGGVQRPRTERVPGAHRGKDPAREATDPAKLDEQLREARRPAVLTLPEQLRSGRLTVTSSAVLAVLALVVALACVFAIRVLWAERSAQAVDAPVLGRDSAVRVTSRAGTGTSPPTGAGGAVITGPAPAQVVVHVVGHVRRPGLVRLAAGSRVADAIERAGGASPGADLSTLNLARVLVDGEQVRVPRPGEVPLGVGAAGGQPGPAGGAGAGSPGVAGPINLNTADLAALDTLPGVGPVLAQRIIDWRTEHGRFTSVEELGEVSGIGDKLYAQIRPRVTV